MLMDNEAVCDLVKYCSKQAGKGNHLHAVFYSYTVTAKHWKTLKSIIAVTVVLLCHPSFSVNSLFYSASEECNITINMV